MQLNYGEFHKIVGGHPSLGDWNVDAAPQMGWSEGDTWSTDVQIPAGQQIEFKVHQNFSRSSVQRDSEIVEASSREFVSLCRTSNPKFAE